MADPDDTDRAMAVARALEKLQRRQTVLEEHVTRLDSVIRDAVEAGNTSPDERPSGPVSWLLLDDADRGLALMADLCDWVVRVYLRYERATLPSCWLWHPDVIEELLWLRHAHADAYHPKRGSWQRVADWHDRFRPKTAARITAAAGHCELSEHRTGSPKARPPVDIPLLTAANRMTEFWTRPDSATATRPQPTDIELHDAQQHQARTYQTN